jgi:MFS family permease
MVPVHVRGRAIGFCSAGVAAVAVAATTVVWGTQKINDDRSFKIPLAIQAACPVLFGLLTLLCPESPVWNIQHGNVDVARSTLMSIRNQQANVVEAEISMHKLAIAHDAERQSTVRFWDILRRVNLKRTLTAGALLSASQVGGQVLVLSFSTVILVQSGVGNPFQVTVIITCLQFLGTLVGPVLVDKLGRRIVALWGFSILFVLNLSAGSLAAAGLNTEPKQTALASVLIVFGFFNAVSFQSL